jgi:small subunit ribosomal protein S2
VTIKQLLEAGVHFGHQTSRWNPKMKRFIFGERNGIYIINLEDTLACLERALLFLKKIAGEGKEILWVGTKKQAQESVREAAERCGMPYVNVRWLGGMLTNFETVRKSIRRLDTIDQMEKEGSFQFVTKKEVAHLKKERENLAKNLAGVRNMLHLPGAVFIVDSKKEEIAVREAAKLGIPIVAVLDTNCDPDLADFPIPGNDDAIRAVKLFCDLAAEAIQEARNQYQQFLVAEQTRLAEEAAKSAEEQAAASEAGAEKEVPEDTIEEKLAERFAGEVEVDKTPKIKAKKTSRKESTKTK